MTRVFVVDDDQAVQKTLARDWRTRSYDVEVATTFEEATAKLAGEDPIDVMLTDLRMPGRDGLDLLHTAKRVSPRTRTILMSAFATAKDHQAALRLGTICVLCKPFTRADLHRAVRQAEECAVGFHGFLHGVGLLDLLRMLHASRRTICVEIGGQADGFIELLEGEIIAASCEEVRGEAAVARLLRTPAGIVTTRPAAADVEHTVTAPFGKLVTSSSLQAEEEPLP